MATRSVLILVFVALFIILAPPYSGVAQNLEGRWVLGFHGGGNLWINDYNTAVVGPGGEVMLRYGISPVFSAGVLVGYEELKSKEVPHTSPFQDYLKLHAIPASADVWVHFCPGEQVNPYIYAGIGDMIYKRVNGDGVYIPNSEYKSSIDMPFGIGVEVFPSKDVSIIADGGYRVTDDYPDGLKIGKIDGYAVAKVGVNVYLGTSYADAEAQRLKEAEARRVEDLANAEARRVKQQADADAEAKRVKDSTDAEAKRVKDSTDAEALRLKQQADANAEARRVKDSTDAEARRVKESADAEARRLAEQSGRDTLIILEKGKTVVLKGVNFETNKATLTRGSEIILERALRALRASPDLNVLIVGHTDNVGTAAYNKKLSFRRAEAVKSWLVGKGISARRLSVAGKGFDEPIDDNTTAEGRANNRRMEFRVLE